MIAALEASRVLPVLTIHSTADAIALRDGLVDGGLTTAEVTLRTDAALDAIRVLSESGALRVGAGTVLTVDDAERALDAGAEFLVSPGTTPAVVDWCLTRGIPVVPGVATPTEALAVLERGLRVAKLFPASVLGGAAWLRALAPVLPDLRFIATGGVDDSSLDAYLACPNLLAVGGSWFLPREELTAGGVASGARAILDRLGTGASS